MRKADSSVNLDCTQWTCAFYGDPVDQRGHDAIQFVRAESAVSRELIYQASDFLIQLNGRTHELGELSGELGTLDTGRVVLEATTLGFPEIYLTCHGLYEIGVTHFDLLYLEPRLYNRSPRQHSTVPSRRDFELSESSPGFLGIPGSLEAPLLRDDRHQSVVFFMGFEAERLYRAMEQHPMIQPPRCSVVFGVPAYQPGWETDAFANAVSVMKEHGINGGVHFCGAENPLAAFEVLVEVARGLEDDEPLFVAPIGTKPHGIGCALFTLMRRDVGVLFDHPKRTVDRSSETGAWHLFEVTLR